MRINYQKLKDIPVETESGEKIGHVHDLEINIENHEIEKYIVSNKRLMVETKKYLIATKQIVKITNEKIVVEDNVEKISITDHFSAKQNLQTEKASPINSESQ